MIDPELLKIIVCPETRTPLAVADASLIARVNEAIEAGRVKNKMGRLVEGPLEGGLVREDGQALYPIVDGIPILLADDAIPLDQVR